MSGFKLDVSKVKSGEKKDTANEIKITFELPDGKTTEEMKFRPDLTVGYLKIELERRHQIPYGNQELILNGNALADPLSLTDYPELKKAVGGPAVKILVKLEGEIEKVDAQTVQNIRADLQNTADDDDDDD